MEPEERMISLVRMHTRVAKLIDTWLPQWASDRNKVCDASAAKTLLMISEMSLRKAVHAVWVEP
eukprot:8506268-Pyramimonas_sp.AAC.1